VGSSVSFGIYFAIAGAVFLDYYKVPDIAKSVPRGVIFGVVGVALPLTMFNGADQLKTLLSDAGTLGLGLIAAALIAKMLTFGVSLGSGFVGGPLFPSLFIGGTAGVLVHQVIPACRSDWRSPACSPPSRGRWWPRRSPWS
jgi:H+/Cl- antiporter ClcA